MANKKIIAVNGINGQLGGCIQQIAGKFSEFDFIFLDRLNFDLSNTQSIDNFFAKHQPHYFINAAAYTAVDKAETEEQQAFACNAYAVQQIAKHCQNIKATLLHISTDYVFDGSKRSPYLTTDTTNPLNVYGKSKLLGERLALENCQQTIIIRTSWVYNKTGKNFVNTMKNLMASRSEISVVADQYGLPTYAPDLAEACLLIISYLQHNNTANCINKVYHYSNMGEAITWHQFAESIKEHVNSNCTVNAITTNQYPTPAKRSAYSVMNVDDIYNQFNLPVKPWQQSLLACLS